MDVNEITAHFSSLNKTPVTIIQDIAVKKQLVPLYDLILNGFSENKPFFKFSLKLGNYVAVGEGTSKKKAKHLAAKNMLLQMINDDPKFLETELKQWDFQNNVVSPYDNHIKINAIGQLNNICANNKLNLPEFNFIREEGQPHARLFTVSCQVSKIIETATHKTKQQAKQLSALQMIDKLKSIEESLVSDIKQPSIPDSMNVLERVEKIKSEETQKKNPPMNVSLHDYHLSYKKNKLCSSDTLDNVIKKYNEDNTLQNVSNHVEVLNNIVQEQKMTLVEQPPIKNVQNDYNCILCIENVYPPIYSFGTSNNIDLAKAKATTELIKNICILYR